MKDLTNRVAIVTGSSSGVGAATARLLAAQGCNVVVNYNSNAESRAGLSAMGCLADHLSAELGRLSGLGMKVAS